MKELLFVICIASCFNSCVSIPNIYQHDRHTVLEAEAAGTWPQLDKQFLEAPISHHPEALDKVKPSVRQKKAHRILNGEIIR